jgi:hypothetical protein
MPRDAPVTRAMREARGVVISWLSAVVPANAGDPYAVTVMMRESVRV